MYQCASMISKSYDGLDPLDNAQLIEALKNNQEMALTILACAAHQRRIVDDVLILNRLENEMLSITPIPVKPYELVAHVGKIFQVELETESISFDITRDRSYNECDIDTVLLDPSRLTQIFINLLGNSAKFVRSSERKRIHIRYGASRVRPDKDTKSSWAGLSLHWSGEEVLQQEQSQRQETADDEELYMRFCVEDTGPGMTLEEIHKLFKRWSQASSITHTQYGGSGLGLYISAALAKRQGGRIGVSSTKGVGSTFAFFIRTQRVKTDEQNGSCMAAAASSMSTAESKLTRPAISAGRTAGSYGDLSSTKSVGASGGAVRSILLVEDNLVNQKLLAKQLRKVGHTVHVANNGFEALDVLKKSFSYSSNDVEGERGTIDIDIDIILMDWEMPRCNGLECSRRIRQMEEEGRLSHLPIVGITANARDEQLQTALAAGMDDILTKPFLLDDLEAKIGKWT
ncbi:hypothetical protein MRB53_040866 [Persea americana]|nr:hypothetical protein MRB53_040866 [Persea americana]